MHRNLTVLYIKGEATVYSIAQEPVDNELGWLWRVIAGTLKAGWVIKYDFLVLEWTPGNNYKRNRLLIVWNSQPVHLLRLGKKKNSDGIRVSW